MIVGAVVCPGAHLPVAGLAPELDALAAGRFHGSAAAVAWLTEADRIILVTSGARDGGTQASRPSVLHPPGPPGGAHGAAEVLDAAPVRRWR